MNAPMHRIAVEPRHFLDLRHFETATLRQMLDVARGFKQAGVPSSRGAWRRRTAL